MLNEGFLNRDILQKNDQKTIKVGNQQDQPNPPRDPTGHTDEAEAPRECTDSGRGCSVSLYAAYPEIWLADFESCLFGFVSGSRRFGDSWSKIRSLWLLRWRWLVS